LTLQRSSLTSLEVRFRVDLLARFTRMSYEAGPAGLLTLET